MRLRYNLPSRNYGSPQAPPSPNFATDSSDLGLQLPAAPTTLRPEYSAEIQNSAETFEDNRNGGAELGRLTDSRKPQSAKQQVEQQQPQIAIQLGIPQVQNGFAHALAVYNPSAQQQQQQLVTQYQTTPQLVLEQQPLVAEQTITATAQPTLVAQPTLIGSQPLLARQTLFAQQPLVAQQPLIAQYPQLTSGQLVAQYRVAPVQQQVFGNLQTHAILNPQQYVQIQPAAALQTVQPIVPAAVPETNIQQTRIQSQPIIQAVVGRLPSGEPFARAKTGKLQAQPISSQQYQIQSNQILGKYQNILARQVAEAPAQQDDQQVEQQPGFAYAAIGF
ncbi:putative uncharacterized protein DDB_G0271606 [Condylostylus longicornis]|uniref:putative uncharacterized protein DDB_G0271606 n=1 Tax=Condylostylus longicornis TaxID=2530218 RepID=UPI00244DC1CF|nr:putative uncharacterized protein DDB_G0271606 [Condylostylus longicornis]